MTTRNIARRVGAAAILVAQLLFIIRGYSADHAVFGFQMFPSRAIGRPPSNASSRTAI
jgi:hypothetical protein